MNIFQGSLLSVKRFRLAIRKIFGVPGNIWVTCNSDRTATAGGSGATPGSYLTVTFPDGSDASTVVGASGAWSVTSAQLASCPSAEELSISTSSPGAEAVVDSIEIQPDGSYLISGHGGRAGDVLKVTIEEVDYYLDLDGSEAWFFTRTPPTPPKDVEPSDVGTESDREDPYVISIDENGDGTYTVVGGGGRVGDELIVVANNVEYLVTVNSETGWTAVVGTKRPEEPASPNPYTEPYVVSITDNGDQTYVINGAGGRTGDKLVVEYKGWTKEITTTADDTWTAYVDMRTPATTDVAVDSGYVEPYIIRTDDNLDGTYTVVGGGGRIGDELVATINGTNYPIKVSADDSWSVIVDTNVPPATAGDGSSNYVQPYVTSVVDNADGTYTVYGAGGRAGDQLTVTIDERKYGITTTADDSWSLIVDTTVPAPAEGSVGTDYESPYVIAFRDAGDGFYVDGAGGRVGDQLDVVYETKTYTITVDADKSWTVYVTKRIDSVAVQDSYVKPYVISVENLGDGTYRIVGGGGLAGDKITISIDNNQFDGLIETDNSWEMVISYTRTISKDEITVEQSPAELDGYVTAQDAIYVDNAGSEMVECSDSGLYISWEAFVEHLKSIIGVDTTALDAINLDYDGGYAKKVLRFGDQYIAAFNYKYIKFSVIAGVVSDIVTIEKNYMTDRNCDVFRTQHGIYYFKKDGLLDRLTRLDGAESAVALDIDSFGDSMLPALVTLGGMEWLVNSDFSISYLIDPVTLEHTQGPVFSEIVLGHQGGLTSIVSADGRVFAECKDKITGKYGIYELKVESFTHLLGTIGQLVGGNSALYVFNAGGINELIKIDLATGQQQTLVSPSSIIGGHVIGDFGTFLRGDETGVFVTYDGGETFTDLFYTPSESKFIHLDCDGDRVIITKQWDTYTLQTYNLIKL